MRPCLKKTLHKKWLVEWFKVEAPSSSPSTAKKTKQNKKTVDLIFYCC
jgi:hypothetical protein